MKRTVAVFCILVMMSSGCVADPESRPPGSLPAATTAMEHSTPTDAQFDGEDLAVPSDDSPETPIETAVPTTTAAAAVADPSESANGGGAAADAESESGAESEVPQSDQTSDQAETSPAAQQQRPAVTEIPPDPKPLANNRVTSMWERLRAPPRSYGELVPQAPFRGLISSEVDYELGDYFGAPLLQYFNTANESLVELRIESAAVTNCYWAMWPERDGLHLSFQEATGDSLPVVLAQWGRSPQVLPRTALEDSGWAQRYISAKHIVPYGDGQIELEHSDTGFILRYGSLVREYTFDLQPSLARYGDYYPNRYLPRMAIPRSLLDRGEFADAVYGELGRHWYPYFGAQALTPV